MFSSPEFSNPPATGEWKTHKTILMGLGGNGGEIVEGVRVAATHGDCGLCVRMKQEMRGRGRGRGKGRGRAAIVVRKGKGRFFDKFL